VREEEEEEEEEEWGYVWGAQSDLGGQVMEDEGPVCRAVE
jgi:hypothetical protein